ncbi:LptF/LptG family permease [Halanaerobaculum tunisiense]
MKIIDRYLALEFIKPLVVTLFILVIVLISSFLFQLTDYIIIKEVPIPIVLKLLLYRLPRIMVRSFSMAVLFATLLSLTRLVKDNEFTALRIGGIRFSRLLVPLLILGVLVSLLTYWFNEQVVPEANSRYEEIIRESVKDKQDTPFHQQVLFTDQQGRYFYLGQINTKTQQAKNILVYNKEGSSRVVSSSRGYFKQQKLYLKSGTNHQLNEQGYVTTTAKLEGTSFQLQRGIDQLATKQQEPAELNRAQISKRIKLLQASGVDTMKLQVEYHLKLAQPLVCLIFVLLGAPLSIKSDRGRIFGLIASVVIVLAYYVLLSISRSLGRTGVLVPWLAAWLPNLVFALLGSYLVIKEEYFTVS